MKKAIILFASVLLVGSLQSFSQRTYPVPEYMGFSMGEDAMTTDTMYLYNVGAQAYLSEGNAWDTQAMMDDDGILLCISKYVPEMDAAWDGKTYEINNYCRSKKSWMQMYIDNETQVFVDHGQQGNHCWLFQIEENDDQTFRIYGADISKYSHDNYPGTYLGVREDIDGSFEGSIYKSRPCVNNNVLPLLNPDEVENDSKVAYHVDWAFVTKAEFERLIEKVEIYNESVELLRCIRGANSLGINTAKEQEVYDNPESTLKEIKDAILSVKNKIPYAISEWPYFPTGTTWKEVIAESGMPLDTLNGAVEYEIGADTTINDRFYKKVLKNGVVQDVFLRVQDGKVMLTADDFAEELLLYDFKWGSNDMLYMELLHDNEGELTKEVISYKTADAYATTVDGKTFSCIQDNSGVVVRDIGRVLDWNRNGCVLGYRQSESVLPGLQAFKLLWMCRGGEEVFRSENADDFTNTSQSVTATQAETKPSATYLLSGQKISADTPSKGIRIIRFSDGTTKKVYTR